MNIHSHGKLRKPRNKKLPYTISKILLTIQLSYKTAAINYHKVSNLPNTLPYLTT